MTEKTTTLILATGALFVLFSLPGCGNNAAQIQPIGNRARPQTTASNEKIRLNNRDMGTVKDLSYLTKELESILRERRKNNTLKKGKDGTYELERDVFLEIDPAVKVGTAARVLGAVAGTGGALRLPFEKVEKAPDYIPSTKPENTKTPAREVKSNPLTLVVSVGKAGAEPPADEDGMELDLTETTVSLSKSAAPRGLLVELRKDGEYVIGGEAVEEEMLEHLFRGYLAAASDDGSKYVVVRLENNADEINFGSVLTIARAAHKSGFPKLELTIYAQPMAVE